MRAFSSKRRVVLKDPDGLQEHFEFFEGDVDMMTADDMAVIVVVRNGSLEDWDATHGGDPRNSRSTAATLALGR